MKPVFVVGYGTLLLRDSLGTSIGADSAIRKRVLPVSVLGYRRLFNLRPTHYDTSYKLATEAIENAALNIEPAAGGTFNGLAFEVDASELGALDARERYYRRVEVPLVHFETGEALGTGHAYASDPDASWISRSTDELMPLWRDIVWARMGAYRVSEGFGGAFDLTTYLADGRTLMVDTYRAVLDDVDDVPLPMPAPLPTARRTR